MLAYPDISPVAVALGPVKVHWYGLMYLIGFAGAWWLGNRMARRPGSGWNKDQVADVIFYGALGVVLGGRIGYILFYNFDHFLADPIIICVSGKAACPIMAACWACLLPCTCLVKRQTRHSFR